MDKSSLPLYNGYEDYYDMVQQNTVFSKYCEKVFGIDFSQDGFSDIEQINDLVKAADIKQGSVVLDIGCGNGKMAEYIADKTNAIVYGFDYSQNAIDSANARTLHKNNLIFEEGVIGQKQYSPNTFDVIMSVDTMYFTEDLPGFVSQIWEWLKPGGIFITYYGEGPEEEISANEDSTDLAIALKQNNFNYSVLDYTKKHFELMRHKRKTAIEMKEQFIMNKIELYYQYAIGQSIDVTMVYDDFKIKFNRNLYIARK